MRETRLSFAENAITDIPPFFFLQEKIPLSTLCIFKKKDKKVVTKHFTTFVLVCFEILF